MARFIKSFAYAFTGIYVAFRSERNLKIHFTAMCLAIILGLYLDLSLLEWGFIVFSIGFVFVAEFFNTAIERLGNEAAHGEQSQAIKNAKDISAAAVLLSALTALVIGILFLLIPLAHRVLAK